MVYDADKELTRHAQSSIGRARPSDQTHASVGSEERPTVLDVYLVKLDCEQVVLLVRFLCLAL